MTKEEAKERLHTLTMEIALGDEVTDEEIEYIIKHGKEYEIFHLFDYLERARKRDIEIKELLKISEDWKNS